MILYCRLLVILIPFFLKRGKFRISRLLFQFIPQNYDWKGHFPMHYTCLYDNIYALKYFSSNVSFWNVLSDELFKTIYTCIEKGNVTMMEFICEKMTEQYDYRDEKCGELIKSLLRYKLNKYHCYGYTSSPLQEACIIGKLDFVKYFLEKIGFKPIRKKGKTSCLHIAVKYRHESIIKYIVHKVPGSLSHKDIHGISPLFLAAKLGYLDAIKWSLNLPSSNSFVKEDHVDSKNNTMLHVASERGHLKVIKYCLNQLRLDINCTNNDNKTSLNLAVLHNKVKVVRYLMGKDEDTTSELTTTTDKMQCISLALRSKSFHMFKLLIDSLPCGLILAILEGKSSLLLAAEVGFLEAIQYIREKLESHYIFHNICNKDTENNNMLHLASCNGHLDIVKYCIEHLDFNINSTNDDKKTSLHLSVEYNHPTIIKYLLSKPEIDLTLIDRTGMSHVLLAIKSGNTATFKFLIKDLGTRQMQLATDGISNLPESGKYIPIACLLGQLDILKYVMENEICHLSRINQDWSFLNLLVENGHIEMVGFLLEISSNCRKNNNQYFACITDEKYLTILQLMESNKKSSSFDVSKLIPLENKNKESGSSLCNEGIFGRHSKILKYRHNCDIYCTIENDKVTPLYLCCLNGHIDVAEYILAKFQCNILKKTATGRTYLHAACAGGILSTAVTFINKYKLDPNTTDSNGITPLFLACENGHESVVKYFVEDLGVDVEHQAKDGKTYLHAACSSGNISVVKLVASSTDKGKSQKPSGVKRVNVLNKKDNNNVTPLDIAIGHGDLEIVKYLTVGKNCEVTKTHVSKAKKCGKKINEVILEQYSIYATENNLKVLDDPKFRAAVHIFRSSPIWFGLITFLMKRHYCPYVMKLCSKNSITNTIEYHLEHHKCYSPSDNVKDVILSYAFACDNIELAKILKNHLPSHYFGILCFILGSANSNKNIIQLLLQNKSWMNSPHSETLGKFMHVVAMFGDKEIFEYLVTEHNANSLYKASVEVEIYNVNMEGSCTLSKDVVTVHKTTQYHSPVFWAFVYGNFEIIKYFLTKPHTSECDYYFLAINTGYLNILKYLIHQTKNKPKESPLFWACLFNQSKIVDYLLSDENYPLIVDREKKITAIHIASMHGHLDLIKMLVDKYSDNINGKDSMNRTPLYFACMNGHEETVKYLASLHWDNSYRDSDGNCYLHAACMSGNKNVVSCLISDLNSDVNCQNLAGKTPIYLACEKQQLEAVKVLLSYQDCDPNIKNNDGESIFHVVIKSNIMNILNLLLESSNLDVNARNATGDTPLLLACSLGHIDPLKKLLLLNTCNPHLTDNLRQNLFHKACFSGEMNVVQYLAENFKRDLNVFNCQDQSGISPVFLACTKGYYHIVKYLHEKKVCDIFVLSNEHQNCLHAACLGGNFKLVSYLSEKFDVNKTDSNKTTPLHIACKKGNLSIIKFLIKEKQCYENTLTCSESTILHASCESNNLDVMCYVILMNKFDLNAKDSEGYTPFLLACKSADLNIIQYLEKLCDKEHQTKEGLTSLHVASSNGNFAVVKYLSSNQFNISCDIKDRMGRTPLYLACLKGRQEVVEYLVEKQKCNLNVLDDKNQSCIHAAILAGQLDMLKYVLRKTKGSFIYNIWSFLFHGSSNMNNNPLYFACDVGQLQIVKYLLEEYNCNTKVVRHDELAPIHVASFKGHLKIISYFVEECNYGIDESLDIFGNSPLHYAAAGGHLAIVKYYDNKNCCKYRCLKVKQFFLYNIPSCLDKVYTNDVLNHDLLIPNTTALHCAAAYGQLEVLIHLIGSDTRNAQVRDANDDTILHVASRTGNKKIVEYILDNKLLPFNVKGYSGVIPLHCASSNGHLVIVKYLISKNECSFLQSDNEARHLLHYACAGGNVQVTEYIIDLSSDIISKTDSGGHTPLHYAVMYGNLDVVQLLIGSSIPDSEYLPRWYEPSKDKKLRDTAYSEAQYEAYQFLLQSEAQDSAFKVPGSLTTLPSLNIVVLGSKSVGKSTLISTLTLNEKFEWLFKPPATENEPNQTIRTTTTTGNKIGSVRFYEMMGDDLLYGGYDSILEEINDPLVLILVNLNKSIDEIDSQIRCWLKIILKKQDKVTKVMIVGTHAQSFDPSNEKKIIDSYLGYIPSSMHIPDFFACDCHSHNSEKMKELQSSIAKFSKKIEFSTSDKTYVTKHLFRYLQHLSKHLVSVTLGSLKARIEGVESTNKSIKKLCDLQVLHETCLHLSSSGRIKYHALRGDNSNMEENVVILNESALLQLIQNNLMSDLIKLDTKDGVIEQSILENSIKKLFPSKYFDTKLFITYLLYSQFCSEISYSKFCDRPLTPGMKYYIFPGLIHFEVKKLDEILWNTKFEEISIWRLRIDNHEFFPPKYLHALLVKIIDKEEEESNFYDKSKKNFRLSKNGALIVKSSTRSLIEISKSKNMIHVVVLSEKEDIEDLVKQRSKLCSLVKSVLRETCDDKDYSEFLVYGGKLYPPKNYTEVPLSDIAHALVKGDKNIILRNEKLTQLSLSSILHKDFFDISGKENLSTLRNDIDGLINSRSSKLIMDETGMKTRLTARLRDEYNISEFNGPITFAQLYEKAIECSLFTTETIYVRNCAQAKHIHIFMILTMILIFHLGKK